MYRSRAAARLGPASSASVRLLRLLRTQRWQSAASQSRAGRPHPAPASAASRLSLARWRSEPEIVLIVLRPRLLLSCFLGLSDKMSSSSSNDLEPALDE